MSAVFFGVFMTEGAARFWRIRWVLVLVAGGDHGANGWTMNHLYLRRSDTMGNRHMFHS
jgi:hypothetical protein